MHLITAIGRFLRPFSVQAASLRLEQSARAARMEESLGNISAWRTSTVERRCLDGVRQPLGAFATTTLGFTSFCLTASLLLASLDRNCRDAADADGGINHQKVFRTTLLILLVIVPATSYAMYAGHIAVMGSEATSLPFHLAGLVYYGRLATIPGLILVMLWCADQLRSRTYL